MSYQVLARKWRPSNFSEVAGQAHVLKSLINALDNERLHHAYLFTGTRGVGKTTLARILAKCLNCEEGISSKPCGKCDSCIEITDGRFIDLMEVDAASRTKVEDTRELLENVQYTPARGRFKVYLIDEVHMLSNHSFNALLKTLEEPPPHVKFLFATTDPQKLPITILSRCLQFNLKNLSPKMISDYLVDVLTQEEIRFDEQALWQIAAAAGGSMRDALTLADQAISYCEGSVEASGVVDMLGVPEQQQVFDLAEHMATGSVESLIKLVSLIAEQTPDYAHTLDSLLSLLHRVAIAQVMPDAIDNSFGDKEKVIELSTKISAEDVQLFYQVGSKGREELRYSADVRSTFEMLLLRMMVFSPTYFARENAKPFANEGALSDPLDSESEKKKNLKPDRLVAQTVVQTVDDDAFSAESEIEAAMSQPDSLVTKLPSSADVKPCSEPADKNDILLNETVTPDVNTENVAQEITKHSASLAKSSLPASLENLTHEYWVSNYSEIPVTGIVANVLANTQLLGVNNTEIHLRLDTNQSAVFGEELLGKIADALSQWLKQPVQVKVDIAEVDRETPALIGQRIRAENHAQMVSGFESDETVQELVSRFSGTLLQDSINAVVKDESKKGKR
ncbi:MAG: DNA polymerase III subunit gamma/tau [Pseudohongiellaceae bacterium]